MIPRLLASYRTTIWRLPDRLMGDVALVGAWNPQSRRLTATANRARERRLKQDLPSEAAPAWGQAPDGAWAEGSWAIPHQRRRTRLLLARYDQHAAIARERGVWRILWRSGDRTPLSLRTDSRCVLRRTIHERGS